MLMRKLNVVWIVMMCVGLGCSPGNLSPERSDETVTANESVQESTSEVSQEVDEVGEVDGGKEASIPEPPPERESPREREPLKETKPISKYPQHGLEGTVVHVTDGDTLYLVMQPGGWASRIRIKGVNAPECYKKTVSGSSFQACTSDKGFYGLKAYQEVKGLLSGSARRVMISCTMKGDRCEKDEFGRFLAYLKLPDGRDLGETVLRKGAAWSFTRYPNKKVASYCQAEADAIRQKAGMWKQGRKFVKRKMSPAVIRWYYNHRPNHDSVCSKAMKTSFSKAAGE